MAGNPYHSKNVYYHGTSEDNAKRILKEGLHPNSEDTSGAVDSRDPNKFAFLAHDRPTAEAFAHSSKPVILKVSPSKKVSRNFVTHAGEFVRSPVSIPAKHIKVD